MIHDTSNPKIPGAVDLVVRPGMRYGDARAGESVRVDAREARIQSVAETLWTAAEHAAHLASEEAARVMAADPTPAATPVGDAIREQLQAAWSEAAAKAPAAASGVEAAAG